MKRFIHVIIIKRFQIHPDSHARDLNLNFPRGLQFLSSVLIFTKNNNIKGWIPLQRKIAVAIAIVFDLQNNKKIPLGKCNGLLYPM